MADAKPSSPGRKDSEATPGEMPVKEKTEAPKPMKLGEVRNGYKCVEILPNGTEVTTYVGNKG